MFSLSRGFHTSPEKGMCLMELVAYLAGEEHTDIPACSSPSLTYMAQYVNDTVSNENRQRLIPLAWELMGTRCDACERIRARESWHYAVGKYGIKDPTYADNDGYTGVCLMDRLYYTYKGDVPFIDIAIDVMRHTIATCPTPRRVARRRILQDAGKHTDNPRHQQQRNHTMGTQLRCCRIGTSLSYSAP